MSEWPDNSSQAYLLESLVNDANKDASTKIEKTGNGYKITSKVNYPNNQRLDHETIETDKDFNIDPIAIENPRLRKYYRKER